MWLQWVLLASHWNFGVALACVRALVSYMGILSMSSFVRTGTSSIAGASLNSWYCLKPKITMATIISSGIIVLKDDFRGLWECALLLLLKFSLRDWI